MRAKLKFITKRVFRFIRELRFMFGLWEPDGPVEGAGDIARFIEVNNVFWPDVECRGRTVLVEGHLTNYGPNYLFRTAVAARAIQETTSQDIEVVFNGYGNQWITPCKVYNSFGIRRFVFLDRFLVWANGVIFCLSHLLKYVHLRGVQAPEDILNIRFNSIKVGDLIYDDVLRETESWTLDRVDSNAHKAIQRSLYFYLQYRLLFTLKSYSYYVTTHTAYSEYGMLARVALMHGVRVVETSDIQMSYYNSISNDRLPTYHDGIKATFLRIIKSGQVDIAALREEAREFLTQRFNSEVKQIDAMKAYRGKEYSRQQLCDSLNCDPDKKIVFVVAHIFKDSPHLSSNMLHADYYQWIVQTLKICAEATAVNWVVKPHPSSALYGEEGMIEEMVHVTGADHVLICPKDLNTKSLIDCADGIVTVHGTAGLEFSCMGIPALLAGQPFYSGFGFTVEPVTREEYRDQLLGFAGIPRLNESQIERALEVYAIWNDQFDWHNPIITSEVLAHVWGSEVERDVGKAYRILTENLTRNDPRKLKLWEFVKGVIE